VEELDATSDDAEWEVATTKRARRRQHKSAASESAVRSRASSVAYHTESEASASRAGSRPAGSKKRTPKKRAKPQPLSVAHRDESQVQLDVDRSFAGRAWESCGYAADWYGRPNTTCSRSLRSGARSGSRAAKSAADRHDSPCTALDASTLLLPGERRREQPLRCSSSHCAKGYHDVISLLLLTLSPDLSSQRFTVAGLDGTPAVWQSAEERDLVVQASSRLSLHWLRDYMTRGLDPALGGLKFVQPELRRALPWLTLLSQAHAQSAAQSGCRACCGGGSVRTPTS